MLYIIYGKLLTKYVILCQVIVLMMLYKNSYVWIRSVNNMQFTTILLFMKKKL